MIEKICTIDQAIERIRMMHDASKQHPLLIGVYGGSADAGKTYFCETAINLLATKGKINAASTQVTFSDSTVREQYTGLEYLFIETGLNNSGVDQVELSMVNQDIRPYTGRDIGANLFIFNPRFSRPDLERLEGIFDIIIVNLYSFRKTRSSSTQAIH